MEVRQPTTVAEALDVLRRGRSALRSGMGNHVDADAQAPAYASRRRRPEWTWEVVDSDGRQLGAVAGQGGSDALWVLDLVALPDDLAAAVALLAAPLAAHGAQRPPFEISLSSAPSSRPRELPGIAGQDAALTAAGYRHQVDRRHYGMAADEWRGGPASGIKLVPVPADDPRLPGLLAAIMTDSLDAAERDLVADKGADAAAVESLALMVEFEGPDAFRLAVADDGTVVGLAQVARWSDGRGCVAFVGVRPEHRGRGHAAALVALATRELLGAGASVVIGSTDEPNWPMWRAFERAGFRHTASRIDYVAAGPPDA